MTLQNRVDPWSRLNQNPVKTATRMGNRGVLHNKSQQIVLPWKLKAWISCVLSFKGNTRKIFSEGRYSELFFLDEATAFSAGHRPCAECQRERSNQFKMAWVNANASGQKFKLSDIDQQLHLERINSAHEKVTFQTTLVELPIGTCFEWHDQAVMIVANQLYQTWSFTGYQTTIEFDSTTMVKVLTPISLVNAFRHGFTPKFHPTAQSLEH